MTSSDTKSYLEIWKEDPSNRKDLIIQTFLLDLVSQIVSKMDTSDPEWLEKLSDNTGYSREYLKYILYEENLTHIDTYAEILCKLGYDIEINVTLKKV